MICDAPIVVGIAAVGRQSWLSSILPALAYVISARLELNEMWVAGVAGAETATSGGTREILPTDSTDRRTREELSQQVDGLCVAWAGEGMTDVATRSVATAFVAAKHRGVPLLSHRRPITRAASPRTSARRVTCLGAAELTLWLARAHLTPNDARGLYVQLASTVAGEQWRWAVNDDEDEFLYWAEEAAAGRL